MTTLKNAVFIIIDLETTGLYSTKKDKDKDSFVPDQIVEIAAGHYQYKKDMRIATSLIKPTISIPPKSSAIHHIINDDVKESPSYEMYASKLFKRIPEDVIMVAHNAPFDKGFLAPAGGVDIVKDRDWICSLRLSRLLFEDLDSHANQSLRYELNLDVPRDLDSHRAEGDIIVTSKILEAEIEKYLSLGHNDDIKDFVKFASQHYHVKEIPNGKYRGELIEDIVKKDLSYLKWYRDNMDTEEDIIISIKNTIEKFELNNKNNISKPVKFKL